MTGAEHYEKAEEFLKLAEAASGEITGYVAACAQVHATLALAAATAFPVERQGESGQWTGYGYTT